MVQLALPAIDLLAIAYLVLVLYFPRHRRRDLVVAYFGVNVGVLAVAMALRSSSLGAGLGMGMALFGVLSIIRLRSTELDQHEVAYYFSALALGLLGALDGVPMWQAGALMALILTVMTLADHRKFLRKYRHQTMVLDSVFTDEDALQAHLEAVLGARVHGLRVQRVDMVNDITVVDVRYAYQPRPRTNSARGLAAGQHRGAESGVAPATGSGVDAELAGRL